MMMLPLWTKCVNVGVDDLTPTTLSVRYETLALVCCPTCFTLSCFIYTFTVIIVSRTPTMLRAFSSFICILVLETDFFEIVHFAFQSLPQLFLSHCP